jgi:hypothetical protein
MMWKALPQQGTPIAEVRIEGSGKGRDVVIVPRTGERLRLQAASDIAIETVGRVMVRTAAIDDISLRVTFSGDLVLERGEVAFDGGEDEWQKLWRRAQTRSRPWWHQNEQELELDWPFDMRITIVGAATARSRPPPTPSGPPQPPP